MITIEVVNKSTVTLPQPLPDILEAIEQQISADFAPAWALEPALLTLWMSSRRAPAIIGC